MSAKSGIRSAYSAARDATEVSNELAEQLATTEPRAITFFCSHKHDGARISGALRRRFPEAEVIGCTTAGAFTQAANGVEAVSALAFGAEVLHRSAAALVHLEQGAEDGVQRAMSALAGVYGPLRELDPSRHVGIMLVEGLRMKEEALNAALGNVAPLLSFVGGSAGDNLEFQQTEVFHNGEKSNDGASLLLLEVKVPFRVAKTCSFEPTGKSWKVTRADVATRTIYELDGRPVVEVYAEAVGKSPAALDSSVFMQHPMGLLIDDKPWIRSPQRVLPDDGLRFFCQVLEGSQLHLMRSTDLVKETADALSSAKEELGGELRGGLAFNCILRRLELDAKGLHEPFRATFKGTETAGFHTYGESWLGHINQTMTALLFA